MTAAPTATGRRYAGQTPAQRTAERRVRLLEAGLELFGTQGYAATTIEAVCQQARVTARHFYECFDSREALLRGVYDRIVDDSFAAVRAALDSEKAGVDLVRAALRTFFHSMLDDDRRARVNFVEVVGVSPAMEAHRRAVLHRFSDLIVTVASGMMAAGEVPERDFTLHAMALVGATQELLVDHIALEQNTDLDALVDVLTEVFTATARIDA